MPHRLYLLMIKVKLVVSAYKSSLFLYNNMIIIGSASRLQLKGRLGECTQFLTREIEIL